VAGRQTVVFRGIRARLERGRPPQLRIASRWNGTRLARRRIPCDAIAPPGSVVVMTGKDGAAGGPPPTRPTRGRRVIAAGVHRTRGLEPAIDGLEGRPMAEASPIGDLSLTANGNVHVVRDGHFHAEHDVAIVTHAGRPSVEIDPESRAAEVLARDPCRLAYRIPRISDAVDRQAARMKLDAAGIGLDRLTPDRERNPASWHLGT